MKTKKRFEGFIEWVKLLSVIVVAATMSLFALMAVAPSTFIADLATIVTMDTISLFAFLVGAILIK